ncbi:pyridoxamine 5'-phosphate oxidase-domain-containing protein [Pyronema omphalodes]|nr:pyridoxamine 5'-phosphate oxidase-domain-containing protein [Pyronema omphalodes]
MRLPQLTLLSLCVLGSSVSANPNSPWQQPLSLSSADRPTVERAAQQARSLLLTETIGTLSTIFPSGERHGLEGQPIGLMDYYADCSSDGNPTFLGMNIATSFINGAAPNSSISLSIREHGTGRFSAAAHPRVALIGKLVEIDDPAEVERVKKCYLKKHPDAKWWSGDDFHGNYWTRLEVKSVYWVGGFGNVAYIGWIPVELYKQAEPEAQQKANTGDWWRSLLLWGDL